MELKGSPVEGGTGLPCPLRASPAPYPAPQLDTLEPSLLGRYGGSTTEATDDIIGPGD